MIVIVIAMIAIILLMGQGYDDIFRTGADTELPAPKADATGDVILRVASLVRSEGAFVDMFRNPGDGPDLSMMGVTTELEVNLLTLGLIQMIRLVVEQDAVFRAVGLLHQHT